MAASYLETSIPDLVWCEFSTSDREPVERFTSEVRKRYPDAGFAFNWSSSFKWYLDGHPLSFDQRRPVPPSARDRIRRRAPRDAVRGDPPRRQGRVAGIAAYHPAMFLTGTLLNAATVLIGTTVGLLVAGRFSERLRESLTIGIGLFTLGIAASMTLPVFTDPRAAIGDSLVVLTSVLIGVALGEWWRIQDRLEWLGGWFERRLARGDRPSSIAEAFVTASLVFCVGPLTVLGSLANGLTGDATLLATKAILDLVSSIAFAVALGPGVYLSVATILIVQGSIAGLAFLLRDILDPRTVLVTTSVGGVILLGMALRLLDLRPVRVANFLPALFLAPILLRVADAIRAALG
jgi:uncharacterized membrane protein YqgA involved in biofilm formation